MRCVNVLTIMNLKEYLKNIQKQIFKAKIIKLTYRNAPHIKAVIVKRFNRTIQQKMWRVLNYLGRKQYSNILQK